MSPAAKGAGWRLLLTGPGEPGFNMALDEALAIAVRRGWSPPTLRIYRWHRPAISLGCHQPVSVLQTFPERQRRGVVLVRRPTAGGAVRHERDTSYALVCGHHALRGNPSRCLYRQFHVSLGRILSAGPGCPKSSYRLSTSTGRSMPDEAVCFLTPVADDLMRGPVKIGGAAQRRWRDGLLQEGTVVEPSVSDDRLALCIRMAWADVFGCRFAVGTLTLQERLLADDLWSKYRPWTPSSLPPVSRGASNPSR